CMDLVNLMYRYINKFINSDVLISDLEKIDLAKYSKNEQKEITKLISDVKNVKATTPNELDEVEKNRLSNINHMLELLEQAKSSEKLDEKASEFVTKQYNQLIKDKQAIRDGGKLYTKIFELMTNNSVVNKYASKMDDLELLEFITRYISVPLPPEIDQEAFNSLVEVGIKEDKRESLWRLAFNYNHKHKDFSLIEDYFIQKRDEYYLTELISAVREDLNMPVLINKIVKTKDQAFINRVVETGNSYSLFESDELEKLK
ncbi:MAG: hypothetical protein K2H20_05065, partial [Bacilli bacterium]|nr:hypothetical protein [Bacilli bacterium]